MEKNRMLTQHYIQKLIITFLVLWLVSITMLILYVIFEPIIVLAKVHIYEKLKERVQKQI